jgi:uncharacterized protein
MKAVLDVNVMLSCAASTSGTLHDIMAALKRGTFSIAISPPMLDTLNRVLFKPYFLEHSRRSEIVTIVDLFPVLADMVEPTPGIHGVAEDDEDDLVLATAIAAGAEYLVTGDRFLLDIGGFRGIQIVTAREFLDLLTADDTNADTR